MNARRKRAKRSVEDAEFAAICRRMVRRLGDRLAEGDPFDLREFKELEKELDAALTTAVRALRAAKVPGPDPDVEERKFSDAEIGAGLGITKQAVQKRFR